MTFFKSHSSESLWGFMKRHRDRIYGKLHFQTYHLKRPMHNLSYTKQRKMCDMARQSYLRHKYDLAMQKYKEGKYKPDGLYLK